MRKFSGLREYSRMTPEPILDGWAVRVAALYDVHGNLPALEAVLADVRAAKPDLIVFGGDLVWGPWPREVLALARSVPVEMRFIKGNTDRAVLTSTEPSFVWSRDQLTADERAFVESWPNTLTVEVRSVGQTLFCHATPRSDTEIVLAGIDSQWVEAAAGVETETVVCGHTHLQFDEEHGGRRWVNPGSVGNPTVRPVAWWAVLGPTVELRVTEYASASAAEAMRNTGFPLPDFADELLRPYTREELVAQLMQRRA
jgi:putative phosphoesterase